MRCNLRRVTRLATCDKSHGRTRHHIWGRQYFPPTNTKQRKTKSPVDSYDCLQQHFPSTTALNSLGFSLRAMTAISASATRRRPSPYATKMPTLSFFPLCASIENFFSAFHGRLKHASRSLSLFSSLHNPAHSFTAFCLCISRLLHPGHAPETRLRPCCLAASGSMTAEW